MLAMPESLNQNWCINLMHDALVCGRRFRTFNVVNYFNHDEQAIEINLNIPTLGVVRVLDWIVPNRTYPLKMRMDNMSELVSLALAHWVEGHGVILEFITGLPEAEILDFYLFRTMNEARGITKRLAGRIQQPVDS
jgi:putative transposase